MDNQVLEQARTGFAFPGGRRGGTTRRVVSAALVALLCAYVLNGCGAQPQPPAPAGETTQPLAAAAAPARSQADCTNLLKLSLPDTTITDAKVVPARAGVPEYCRVVGGMEKSPTWIGNGVAIVFEIGLPTSAWNGKFWYVGGGGYNGNMPDLSQALAKGYAAVGTDTGHRGEHWDASALLDSPQIQINYAHRGQHIVTVMAKQVVKAYYGKPEAYSYFVGCSNGGKMGLMAAQRYPEDFDGIIVGGMVIDRTGLMLMFAWTQRALLGAEIRPSKIPAMEKATLAACDAVDGLTDGLISRPDQCKFDPKVLTCKGADSPDCLTPAQVTAFQKILDGPRNSAGKQLYPGYSPGHEGDYGSYVTGLGLVHGYPSSNFMYMDSMMRWMVFGPKFDSVRQFDFDKSPAALVPFEKDQDASATDLSAFKARGGRLIMYNGWADHSTPPLRAIQYYEDVRENHGAATDDFVKLFLPPGLYHCSRGPGPNSFGGRGHVAPDTNDPEAVDKDLVTLLERWVEQRIAPTKIIATKFKDDDPTQGVVRTRPVCAYPQVAKFKGSGSVDEAANFTCVSPEE